MNLLWKSYASRKDIFLTVQNKNESLQICTDQMGSKFQVDRSGSLIFIRLAVRTRIMAISFVRIEGAMYEENYNFLC